MNYLIDQYLMYIDYIDLCFESGEFLPLIQHKRYMAWLYVVDKYINSLELLLIERTPL